MKFSYYFLTVFFIPLLTAAIPVGRLSPLELVLALKYVEFNKGFDSENVHSVVQKMNAIYRTCQIQFHLEKYTVVNPADYGLASRPISLEDMENFRKPFDDPRYLVIIHTGNWQHQNIGPANAWTAMPGEIPSGAVIEGSVGSFPEIIAHELGHYLSLDHVEDEANLMNPIIYGKSHTITLPQCQAIRSTALTVRGAAIRQQT